MRHLMETYIKTAMAPATIENCNNTMGNMRSLKTPMGMLLQIEVLVIIAGFLLLFLVTFGSCRRRYNSKTLRFIIFAAYTLSTYVLTYTLGLMQDAPLRSELFPVWAMFLMLALGSADSISAYSLEDNERWKRYNWQLVIKSIWLVLLAYLYFRGGSNLAIKVAALCLFIVWAVKSDERARALMGASRHSLERKTKVVADHMSAKHESEDVSRGEVFSYFGKFSLGEVDPASDQKTEVDPARMRGYPYLVRGEEESWLMDTVHLIFNKCQLKNVAVSPPDYRTTLDEAKLVTTEKVWECGDGGRERLLGSEGGDPHNKLKDICLSFALFKLLRLRYAGHSLPPRVHENTWKLIRHILQSKENGYKRAFRVVEVELAFLYDFFYTKYGIIFRPGRLLLKLMELYYVALGIWAMILLLKDYKSPNSNCELATLPNGLSVDVLMTIVMIIWFIVVELMQFFYLGFSDWAKVMWICKYVQYKSWQGNVWIERIIRAICGVRLQKPWERKLRQYSFLERYSHKPCWLWNNAFMAAYIDQTRDGQKESTPIPLPKEVKQAVFHALKSKNGTKLENGRASLRVNKVSKELSWACQLETQTQVIMVWHIATSFCEHQKPVTSDSPGWTNFLVATSLSKYLAYLVAFAPQLLPDHPYLAEHLFAQVIIEARIFFRKCKRMKERVAKMNKTVDKTTVIERGAQLGNQLVNDIKDEGTIWKILADFWVEQVLYVAPSDNAKAHAEHLARGGEFVTHLWALLSHAGFERDHPTTGTNPRNAHKRSYSF